MDRIRNEKGYALLLVMLLVVLFTLMGMGLLTMNMNAAKQFNTKEEQVQARHQAEMGILHYSAMLEEKIKNSSATAMKCSDIDALLGITKKITAGNYIVEPVNALGSSCKEIENSKLLEITIKSKGIINEDTIKEVKATFYAANQGASTSAPIAGGSADSPTMPTSPDTVTLSELTMKKEIKRYTGNLIINTKLDIEGGNSDSLIVAKDLYITGNIVIQNHACIAAGGNFVALKSFNWGHSKTSLLVRNDAYLPSTIGNWQKIQVNAYVFGDLYLPRTYNYEVKKQDDRNLYIAGKVYQLDSQNKYKEITNPFKALKGQQVKDASKLSCGVTASKEDILGVPKWILQDEKIINYQ